MSKNDIDEGILNGEGIKPLPDDDDDDDLGGTKNPPYGGVIVIRRFPSKAHGRRGYYATKAKRHSLVKAHRRAKLKKLLIKDG